MGTLSIETEALKNAIQSFIDAVRDVSISLDRSLLEYRDTINGTDQTLQNERDSGSQQLITCIEEISSKLKAVVDKASLEILVEKLAPFEKVIEEGNKEVRNVLQVAHVDFTTALRGYNLKDNDSDATIDNPLEDTSLNEVKELAVVKEEPIPDKENERTENFKRKRKLKITSTNLRVKMKHGRKKMTKRLKPTRYSDYNSDTEEEIIPEKKTKRKQPKPRKAESETAEEKDKSNNASGEDENQLSESPDVKTRLKRKYTKALETSRFRCKICVKAFSSKATLKLHVKTSKHLEKLKELKAGILAGNEESTDDDSRMDFDDLSAAMEVDKKPRKISQRPDHMPQDCTLCGERQNSRYLLKQHYLKVHPHELDKNACDICKKPFPSEEDLKQHLFKHRKKRHCELCDKTFSSTSRYRDHLGTLSHFRRKQELALQKREEGKQINNDEDETLMFPHASRICSICGQTFSSKTSLYNHVHAIHSTSKDFVCDICGKSWNCRAKLTAHIDTHLKRYKCEYCDDVFSRKRLRDSHQRIHTGETPFQCPHCPKSFREGYLLRKHVKTHSQVRPYNCTQCDAKFKIKGHLQRHEQQVHDSIKPHKCPFCPEAYGEKRMLQKHMYSHTGESNVRCEFCGKFLANLNSLNTHLAQYHNQPLNSRALPIHNENSSKRFDSYKAEVSMSSSLLNLSTHKNSDCMDVPRTMASTSATNLVNNDPSRETSEAKDLGNLEPFLQQTHPHHHNLHQQTEQQQQQQNQHQQNQHQHQHKQLIEAKGCASTANAFPNAALNTSGTGETENSNPFFQHALLGNTCAPTGSFHGGLPIFAAHAHHVIQTPSIQHHQGQPQSQQQVHHGVQNTDEATRAAVFAAAAAQSDLMRPLFTVSMGGEAERNLFHYAYERQMLQ